MQEVQAQQIKLDAILLQGLESLGIKPEADPEQMKHAFAHYMDALLAYNAHTNLTAITEPEEIYIKHFVDSASAIVALEALEKEGKLRPKSARYIDVGTGAGFPSVPIKLVLPSIELTLLDSLEKRTRFLESLRAPLGLTKTEILHDRAEDAARKSELRAQFDVVLSRAVAALPVLLEYSLPFLRVGGFMVCLKGPKSDEEIAQSKRALSVLGGRLKRVINVAIPGDARSHKILIIEKMKETPKAYPRKAGKPAKEPLS